jgi:hypothetical protein
MTTEERLEAIKRIRNDLHEASQITRALSEDDASAGDYTVLLRREIRRAESELRDTFYGELHHIETMEQAEAAAIRARFAELPLSKPPAWKESA